MSYPLATENETEICENPFSLDRLTRVGKHPISYEIQSTNPLSLRERARVKVSSFIAT